MANRRIEETAREVLAEIWEHRKALTGKAEPLPIEVLDPQYAARVLGIDLVRVQTLETFKGSGFEAAGFLDRDAKLIAVADRFGYEVLRFTGSHEIGHWLLHPDEVMLRERPIRGLAAPDYRRPIREREADGFAGYFLMPRKVVEQHFVARFGPALPFKFDYHAAYELGKGDAESILRPRASQKTRAFALATARSYRGQHFASLADAFRVSAQSMSLQLEELGLVNDEC